jgi:hypothetical protein
MLSDAILTGKSIPAPQTRVVAFEQVLVKNRIRPMTSYHGQPQQHKFNTVNNPRQDQSDRIKSAKPSVKENGQFAVCRNQSNHLKRISAKTTGQARELEYRLVYKKGSGGVQSSNMLLKLMNKNIAENIANNPYAKEISNQSGVKIKAISRKSSVNYGATEKNKTHNRFFSAVGNRSSDDEMDTSTQPPKTDDQQYQSASVKDSVAHYHTH